jgi:hypothetical protein
LLGALDPLQFMSDLPDFGFAPPPFKADEALVLLRRALRDLKPLAERGTGFELRGRPVLELAVADGAIAARLARRPAVAPEWDRITVTSGADQRKLLDEVRKRVERWTREEP